MDRLPNESMINILRYVSAIDLLNFSLTNRFYFSYIHDEIVWKRLIKRSFPNIIGQTPGNCWQTYQQYLNERKKLFVVNLNQTIEINRYDNTFKLFTSLIKQCKMNPMGQVLLIFKKDSSISRCWLKLTMIYDINSLNTSRTFKQENIYNTVSGDQCENWTPNISLKLSDNEQKIDKFLNRF